MDASVVVPSRDRALDLERCLAALACQATQRTFEVIIVDDGSDPPLRPCRRPEFELVVVRRGGCGPAAARNAGVCAARASVVLFTDDDCEPAPTWLEAACAHLETNARDVGVEGPVRSAPWDYLYAHSLENSTPGAYWTCNVAYRRAALEALGGFDEGFPFPHGEDRDLAYRALDRHGSIGFVSGMAVRHQPRPLSVAEIAGRGRMAPSDVALFRRHRLCFGRETRIPARLYPLYAIALGWSRRAREDDRLLRSPRRLLRFAACAGGQLATAAFSVAGPLPMSVAARVLQCAPDDAARASALASAAARENGASDRQGARFPP